MSQLGAEVQANTLLKYLCAFASLREIVHAKAPSRKENRNTRVDWTGLFPKPGHSGRFQRNRIWSQLWRIADRIRDKLPGESD